MNDKRIIDFPQNVLDVLSSDVLRIDYAELRSIYKDWRTEICNREDFMRRFRNVYDPDCDLIVCCCTDGIPRYPNSQKVLELYKVLSNYPKRRFPLLKMEHPSRWDKSCKHSYVSILEDTSERFLDDGKHYCFEKHQALCKYLLRHGKECHIV